jgi:hypothetical protein
MGEARASLGQCSLIGPLNATEEVESQRCPSHLSNFAFHGRPGALNGVHNRWASWSGWTVRPNLTAHTWPDTNDHTRRTSVRHIRGRVNGWAVHAHPPPHMHAHTHLQPHKCRHKHRHKHPNQNPPQTQTPGLTASTRLSTGTSSTPAAFRVASMLLHAGTRMINVFGLCAGVGMGMGVRVKCGCGCRLCSERWQLRTTYLAPPRESCVASTPTRCPGDRVLASHAWACVQRTGWGMCVGACVCVWGGGVHCLGMGRGGGGAWCRSGRTVRGVCALTSTVGVPAWPCFINVHSGDSCWEA